MPAMPQQPGKEYRIRQLRRGDRDLLFRLLASEGWVVGEGEQETVLSWVVQHPEMESLVAHEAASFTRVIGIITMSHRPQLRLGGRVATIDLFVVGEPYRGTGVGTDLLQTILRRTEALGCKRVELALPSVRDGRHDFFEQHGFAKNGDELFVRRNPPPARK
jgi:GNAT superfamily N-acetyltransferase